MADNDLEIIQPMAPEKTAHEKLMEAYERLHINLDLILRRIKERKKEEDS
jgi:hypothetical protein